MQRIIKFRAWDGDKRLGYKVHGYQMRKASYHPNANSRGYVQEHRLIIENQLGRYLTPRKELVHHINGARDDNALENLELSNPKDHAKGHIGERNPNGGFAASSGEFQKKKFRLYDKDRNLTKNFTLSELIGKTFRRGSFEYRGEFTGLKDKNGVEIYEGDILNICFTSGSGEYIHDGIYVAETRPLKGIVFNFKALLWSSHGYNQYPTSTELSGSNGIGSIYQKDRPYLYAEDRYKSSVDIDRQFPFNEEKELAFHSRYFEVIGNKYTNPELLES